MEQVPYMDLLSAHVWVQVLHFQQIYNQIAPTNKKPVDTLTVANSQLLNALAVPWSIL